MFDPNQRRPIQTALPKNDPQTEGNHCHRIHWNVESRRHRTVQIPMGILPRGGRKGWWDMEYMCPQQKAEWHDNRGLLSTPKYWQCAAQSLQEKVFMQFNLVSGFWKKKERMKTWNEQPLPLLLASWISLTCLLGCKMPCLHFRKSQKMSSKCHRCTLITF